MKYFSKELWKLVLAKCSIFCAHNSNFNLYSVVTLLMLRFEKFLLAILSTYALEGDFHSVMNVCLAKCAKKFVKEYIALWE